jgi:hypothetical protein
MDGLSHLQKNILRWLLNDERARKHLVQADGHAWWGSPWQHRRADRSSPAIRAADSRALRRLEERGLVLRDNTHQGVNGRDCIRDESDVRIAGSRTTHVRLTLVGWTLAGMLPVPEADG